ncbi:hypothetical protein GCM10028801_43480 [Nocardioides maradonensis]
MGAATGGGDVHESRVRDGGVAVEWGDCNPSAPGHAVRRGRMEDVCFPTLN